MPDLPTPPHPAGAEVSHGSQRPATPGSAPESEPEYAPEYEQPLVSIDVVPVTYADEELRICLAPRINPPHLGELALPGVLLGRERSVDAAQRALRVKARVEDTRGIYFRDIGVFDDPGRDPRGPTMAVAKLAILSPDVEAGVRVPVTAIPALPFDHRSIIDAAVYALQGWMWRDRTVTRALHGESFSARDAARVERALATATGGSGAEVNVANLKRRLLATGWVRQTDRLSAAPAHGGRPSYLWEWVEEDPEP